MTFDQILYFIETAKHEHVTIASRLLHVTPSTISHAISSLEDELGLVLFERKGRNVSLTPTGKDFFSRASVLLDEMRKIKEDFSSSKLALQNACDIAASHGLAEIVAQVLPEIDCIEIGLLSHSSADVINRVLEGKADLGVCYSPQSHPKLYFEEVYRGSLRIVLANEHPLLLGTKNDSAETTLRKLSHYPACFPRSYLGIDVCRYHEVLNAHGIAPSVKFTFDSYSVALSFLKDRNAWSLVPDCLLKSGGGSLSSEFSFLPCPKSWEAPFKIQCVTLNKKSASKYIDEVVLSLRDHFKGT